MVSIFKDSERLSNFEALRLLCMLMVLNLHSFWGYNHGSGFWQAADFFRESTSICAVDCFILISGYFGIKWKIKSFFNLTFQLFYYSIGIYLVVAFFGIVDWNLKQFFLRFACLATHSWAFAVTYVLLYFCAPVLNAFAEKVSSRELFLYIMVFFLAINFVSVPRFALFTYALVYLIGRFLRQINIADINLPAAKAYWITTTLIFIIVYYLLFKLLHIADAEIITKWPIGFIGFDYAAPLVIAQSVFLFIVFAKMKFSSSLINYCAKSCFAIFLIHLHPTIKQIGYYSYSRDLYNLPVFQHIIALILLIAVVFFGCIIVDKIRIAISDRCFVWVERLTKSISPKWAELYTYISDSIERDIKKTNKTYS